MSFEMAIKSLHICPKCGGRLMYEYEAGKYEPVCFNCGKRVTRNPDVREKGRHTGLEPRHHHLLRTE